MKKFLVLLFAILGLLAGCSNGSKPAISVSASSSATTVQAGSTAQITATIANDSSQKGVTWSMTCSTASCGTVSPTSSTTSPYTTTYTAPTTPPSIDLTVTIKATSVADSTKSASATITVPAITVSVSPATATVLVNTTDDFTASVANDPSSAGVTWSLTQGGTACSPTCGSLSNLTTTSVTYDAPATLPTSPTVTLTAASVTDGTKTASATITLTTVIAETCDKGSESLLKGQYAFLLKGFDNGTPRQPALIGGVITVDGAGKVTAGTMDMNLAKGVQEDLSVTAASSSYSVGPDNRGCMTLSTSAGTQDYRFSLGGISSGVASTGHMIDFDATGPFTTGVLRKQDPAAFSTTAVSGHFAFGVSSRQSSNFVGPGGKTGGKIAAVGVIYLSAGAVTGGVEDLNVNGQLDGNSSNTTWPASPLSITGGTYTGDSTSGRGTMTFNVSGTTFHDAVYVVSSSQVLLMSIDDQITTGITAGTALKQASSTFSTSWLNGTGVFYYSSPGPGGPGTTWTQIGTTSGDGSGSFTGTTYQNISGTFASGTASGTFTIDSATGRVLLGTAPAPVPVLYAVNTNEAFLLSPGGIVLDGFMQSQSGSFSTSLVQGTASFGTINPESFPLGLESGVGTLDGVSEITFTLDDSYVGTLDPDTTFGESYSVDPSGLAHMPAGCTVSSSYTTCDILFLFITPTKAVGMEVSPTDHPIIITVEH